jgi:hypothetical protein
MNDYSPRAAWDGRRVDADVHDGFMGERGRRLLMPIGVALLAFAVYWLTAVVLEARGGIAHFGADSDHYKVLAHQWINHRAARFHPTTIVLAVGWMKLFAPLTAWFAPELILKAFFAAIGAVGVWAAAFVFSTLLPRGYAMLATLLYGSSLGIWYFSGIPESKIVTATLSLLYIAAYIQFRDRWTTMRMAVLTVILAVACLNEIVSCFLFAIPAVDVVQRYGLDWRRLMRLVPHAIVVPIVWLFLEIAVNGWIVPESKYHENQSHYDMLIYYLAKNDYSLTSLYGFILNWFFFNIAAPTQAVTLWPQAGGYFAPSFAGYFETPISGLLVVLLVAMVVASLLPRYRAESLGVAGGLLLPLVAFSLIRAVFFFGFNPSEPILFSPSVTLVYWLLLLVPFVLSSVPGKRVLLTVLAALLIATNAGFMIGPNGWANAVRFIAGA